MVVNATFNNSSVISWRSALLVEETGGPGENRQPLAIHFIYIPDLSRLLFDSECNCTMSFSLLIASNVIKVDDARVCMLGLVSKDHVRMHL